MITINLLPQELQPDIRKAKSQLLSIAGSVLLVLVSGGFWIVIHFFTLPAQQQALNKVKGEERVASQYTKDHKEIGALQKQLSQYGTAVKECKAKQVKFSKKLSQFASIITKDRIYWADNLTIKTARAARVTRRRRKKGAATGPKVVTHDWDAACVCKAMELKKVFAIVDAMKADKEFYQDVAYVQLPVPSEYKITGDYVEQKGYAFKLKWVTKVMPKGKTGPKKRNAKTPNK